MEYFMKKMLLKMFTYNGEKMLKKMLKAVKAIKPMKTGILIKDKQLIVLGYNSKTTNGVHSIKVDSTSKKDAYLEFYTKDLDIIPDKGVIDFSIDELSGKLNIFLKENKTLTVDSLGSYAREKQDLLDIYFSEIDDFYTIPINNINLEQVFNNTSLNAKTAIEYNQLGLFFSKVTDADYFVLIKDKIIQLLKSRSNYTINGTVKTNINRYKITSMITKMLSLNENNTLYIYENKENIVYIDNYETYIITPIKDFKYVDISNERQSKLNLIKKTMESDRKIVLRIADKQDFLDFLGFSNEDFFLYIKDDNVLSKKSLSGNYYKANDVFEIIKDDRINKEEELMFSLKINTLKTILENQTIEYITLDLNSQFVILSDYKDLTLTYSMCLFKTSNYF